MFKAGFFVSGVLSRNLAARLKNILLASKDR